MGKKDCLKKARELEKSNATYGLFVASYYYFAAEEYGLMRDALIKYHSLLGKHSPKRKSIGGIIKSLKSSALPNLRAFLFDKHLLPDNFVKRDADHLKSMLLNYAYNLALYISPENMINYLAMYVTEDPANFLKARDLLLK